MTASSFELVAIVAVDEGRKVRCQQPHCGHSVYARIHVVEEGGQLLVLGSDCFAKRFGSGHTSGFRGFGGGGGRVLTEDERELLLNNTAALLAQFEAERQVERELAASKMKALRELQAAQQARFTPRQIEPRSLQAQYKALSEPTLVESLPMPKWASLKKPNSSFFAYGMDDGQCWVLMQSGTHTGCFITPAPTAFEGWDEALPLSIGNVEPTLGVYVSDKDIHALVDWFKQRCTHGSRIDSDPAAIQNFALNIA